MIGKELFIKFLSKSALFFCLGIVALNSIPNGLVQANEPSVGKNIAATVNNPAYEPDENNRNCKSVIVEMDGYTMELPPRSITLWDNKGKAISKPYCRNKNESISVSSIYLPLNLRLLPDEAPIFFSVSIDAENREGGFAKCVNRRLLQQKKTVSDLKLDNKFHVFSAFKSAEHESEVFYCLPGYISDTSLLADPTGKAIYVYACDLKVDKLGCHIYYQIRDNLRVTFYTLDKPALSPKDFELMYITIQNYLENNLKIQKI